ncbi:MAG: electron transfer flavoprotein subunit alpha/FixB family protein [Acidimicrobiia bacterium]|nr:electron transfer flavoprotein subunit alpha/FixB family protein [Acidimicrobiia bacterium]
MAIWVFSSEVEGAPSPTSLELLTKARSLDTDVAAVYLGTSIEEAATVLGAHGAATVYHLSPAGALPAAGAAGALAELASAESPRAILFGMGPDDRDVAGRFSARTGTAVVANAIDIRLDGDTLIASNEILGGTVRVDTEVADRPGIVIARPKAFAAEPGDGAAATITPLAMEDGRGTVLESHVEQSEGPDLTKADVVVSGGRGLGGADKFELIDKVAGLLGGAVGATRAVVDSGWVPYSHQIGQTGKTVKPSVYIAAGISGAMQHVVGMKDSGTIIAINKDPEAPIFGIADLGIVGDVNTVLPKLIEALEAR